MQERIRRNNCHWTRIQKSLWKMFQLQYKFDEFFLSDCIEFIDISVVDCVMKMLDLLLNFDLLSCQRFFKADKMNGWFWEWRYFNDIKRTTNNFWYPKAKMKFDIEIQLKPNQQKVIKAALKTFKAYSIKISSKTPPQYHHTWLPLKSNFIPFKLITSTREEKKTFKNH